MTMHVPEEKRGMVTVIVPDLSKHISVSSADHLVRIASMRTFHSQPALSSSSTVLFYLVKTSNTYP